MEQNFSLDTLYMYANLSSEKLSTEKVVSASSEKVFDAIWVIEFRISSF